MYTSKLNIMLKFTKEEKEFIQDAIVNKAIADIVTTAHNIKLEPSDSEKIKHTMQTVVSINNKLNGSSNEDYPKHLP